MMKIFLIAGIASLCAVPHPVHAATETLRSLLGGTILDGAYVSFSNFAFTDTVTSPFPGDFNPNPDEITVTASATSSTARLQFDFDPSVALSGFDPDTGLEHIFDFFIDFQVSVTGGSGRTLTELTLGDGDLGASGTDSLAEVIFHDSLPIPAVDPRVEIFEDPSNDDPALRSQNSESTGLANFTSLSLFGSIKGKTTEVGATSGLSTFALTFDLDGTPPVTPPATPVPLPASLPLIFAGLGGLALLRRRKNI